MTLETLIRQAKPNYIRGDAEQAEQIILENVRRLTAGQADVERGSEVFSSKQGIKRLTRGKSWRSALIIAACVSVIGLGAVASGFVVPTMASALSHLPIVGGLFSQKGDAGLKAASSQGLVSEAAASDTHKGVTFSISDVVYDGARISMVLTRTSEDGKNEPLDKWTKAYFHERSASRSESETNAGLLQFWADQQKLNVGWSLASDIGYHHSAILTIEPDPVNLESFHLPDEFQLAIQIRDSKLKQDFKLDLPVKKIAAEKVIVLSESDIKSTTQFDMTVKRIELTPITLRADIALTAKEGSEGETIKEIGDSLQYEIWNERGEMAQAMGYRGSEIGDSDYVRSLMFEPFTEIPQSIIIKPYTWDGKNKVYLPELETVLFVK
ncbi:DUF4179 domain-containing protein [Paenibacillus sp. NPDC058071]|uniref:DUF4179 domain-containing protein n=1 Tax=Paenibacillus sp. NPDC058071 TaxID=3346326 RepID=UPI0036DC7BD2